MTLQNRTKIMFANTMKELMQSTPLHEIRVTEICKLCGSDRKTFYYHFKDKYDLVAWIYSQSIQSVLELSDGNIGMEESIQIFNKLKEDASFYKNAYNDYSQNALSWYIQQNNVEIYTKTVKKYLNSETISKELEFSILYHCYASFHLSKDWILDKLNYNTEELTNYIFENMPISLKKIISNKNNAV